MSTDWPADDVKAARQAAADAIVFARKMLAERAERCYDPRKAAPAFVLAEARNYVAGMACSMIRSHSIDYAIKYAEAEHLLRLADIKLVKVMSDNWQREKAAREARATAEMVAS